MCHSAGGSLAPSHHLCSSPLLHLILLTVGLWQVDKKGIAIAPKQNLSLMCDNVVGHIILQPPADFVGHPSAGRFTAVWNYWNVSLIWRLGSIKTLMRESELIVPVCWWATQTIHKETQLWWNKVRCGAPLAATPVIPLWTTGWCDESLASEWPSSSQSMKLIRTSHRSGTCWSAATCGCTAALQGQHEDST